MKVYELMNGLNEMPAGAEVVFRHQVERSEILELLEDTDRNGGEDFCEFERRIGVAVFVECKNRVELDE